MKKVADYVLRLAQQKALGNLGCVCSGFRAKPIPNNHKNKDASSQTLQIPLRLVGADDRQLKYM